MENHFSSQARYERMKAKKLERLRSKLKKITQNMGNYLVKNKISFVWAW